MSVLIIGRNLGLIWVLPQLFHRADFNVDLISSYPLLRMSRFVRRFDLVPTYQSLIPCIAKRLEQNYDWVVITDDGTLREVADSSLSLEQKLKILPVLKQEDFTHLYSKIGLSKVLSRAGISTPPFFEAHTILEARAAARELGYPILLKQDASGGGSGIHQCNYPADFDAVKPQFFDQPVLVQKKIAGLEIDLSAIFLKGSLIHFSYSTVNRIIRNSFGPSSIRTYTPLSFVDSAIFDELSSIGEALGAHGFTNLGALQSGNRRYYFEVDMRPNAWIEIPRYFELDPAIRIRRGQTLKFPVPALPNQPSKITIPYFLRLTRFELLFNRYRVWKYIPKEDPKLVFRVILDRFFSFEFFHPIILFLKRVLPKNSYEALRKIKYHLSRL
jgi:hypothetical protein